MTEEMEVKEKSTLADRLKWLMERDGISARDLSERLGVTYANIWRYVQGMRGVKVGRAIEIADIFHVDVGWLVGQESARAPEGWEE